MADTKAEIIIREGDREIARHLLEPRDYVIGRDPTCQIPIASPALAPQHAQLSVGPEDIQVEDLGSGTGTFVNGVPVTGPTKVTPEQQIQLGPISILVRPFLPTQHDATMTLHEGSAAGAPVDQTIVELPPAHAEALPVPPRSDQKYDIGPEVARGGMGAVLQAKDRMIRRGVAMKVMLRAGSEQTVARFVAEAQITGQLEHPGIVPVYDLGLDDNHRPYYTMKFVRGLTLRAVLEGLGRQAPKFLTDYPLAKLLTIFQKVCDALAFAHARGVLHRDLKPDNIMIGDYGEVLVMDWGLAKVRGQATPATAPGSATADPPGTGIVSSVYQDQADSARTLVGDVMGTPTFMSPEQASGAVEQLDARSDIFALGAILYNILTLEMPFRGAGVNQILEKVRQAQVPPATEATAGKKRLGHLPGGRVPASLSAVAHKALARRPQDRYQSVPDLQHDIEAYQHGFATSAEHATLLKQLVLLVRRHKAMCGTACAAGLLIAGLTVWFVINLQASERKATHHAEIATKNEQLATHNAQIAAANEQKAVAEKEAARVALAQSQLALAEAAFREPDGPAMQAALTGVPEDLRDSNWNYLLAQSDTSLATLRSHSTSRIRNVVPHPQKPGVFAIAGGDGCVALVEARTGAQLREFQVEFNTKGYNDYRLAFTPDGEKLAVGRAAGGIIICDVHDGRKLLEWSTTGTSRLLYSPDGRQLLGVQDNAVMLWDATTGRRIWSQPAVNCKACFHPGGQFVLVSSRANLNFLDVRDGAMVQQAPDAHGWIDSLAVKPDGLCLWCGGVGGWLRCVSTNNAHTLYETRLGRDQSISALAYLPDGNRLVTLVNLPGARQAVQVWDADTMVLLQSLLGSAGHAEGLSIHPLSGEVVVWSDLMTKVWAVARRNEKWRSGNNTLAHTLWFWNKEDWLFGDHRLFDLSSPEPFRHPLWQRDYGAGYTAVSADGRFAAVADLHPPFTVRYLRTNGQRVEEVHNFQGVERNMRLLALSPTGERLVIANSVLDPATGTELQRLPVQGNISSPPCWLNNTQVVLAQTVNAGRGLPGSAEQLVLCDTATGKVLHTATSPGLIYALAAAPDGRTIAEAGADRMVRLRDPVTLAVVRAFRAHNAAITALAFHPQRPILATASQDMTIKLWDLSTDRQLDELCGPTVEAQALAFSPSGRRIAAGLFRAQTAWIWEPDSLNPDAAPPPADGWVDLLGKLCRADVAKNGYGWQFNGGVLVSPNRHFGAVALPGNFARRSYQVRLKLRQLSAQESIHIILPVADHHTTFMLDGFPSRGYWSCLNAINDTDGAKQPGTVKGKVVQDAELHDLELTIRLKDDNVRFAARLDDQPLYQWSGPAGVLGMHISWPTLPPGCIGLGTHAADWVVYAVKVKALDN